MGGPRADKNEPMKQTEVCDPPKDEEEMEVAKDSVNSKNDGIGEERNIAGNQVTLDLLVDDESEEKEDEISTTQEKPSEVEKEVKNNSKEEKPKLESEED
ncbi:hypothetical protein CRYUN_Cryun26dG0119800 [Craigia yunnanensis]